VGAVAPAPCLPGTRTSPPTTTAAASDRPILPIPPQNTSRTLPEDQGACLGPFVPLKPLAHIAPPVAAMTTQCPDARQVRLGDLARRHTKQRGHLARTDQRVIGRRPGGWCGGRSNDPAARPTRQASRLYAQRREL